MTAEDPELGAKTRTGLLWTGGFRMSQGLVQVALSVVLVRLLSPDDYGTYALVASIVGFLNAVSFESFLAYTIQVRRDDEVHYQDHFTAAVVIQCAIFVATNLVALALRWMPGYSGLAVYVHVLSPTILLSCLAGFRMRMLERSLDWPRLQVQTAVGAMASGITAVVLALSGAGVYALLLAPHVKYLPVIADLLLFARWRPTWAWSWRRYRAAWRFGLYRTASSVAVKGRAMLESNVLAHLLGLAALGHFGRAIGMARLASSLLVATAVQSVYPVLTRFPPGSSEFARAGSLLLRGAVWALLPLNALLTLQVEPVVRLLLGGKWLSIVPLVPWAMLLASLAAVSHCAYHISLGNQQQRQCLWYDTWGVLGTGLALAIVACGAGIRVYVFGLIVVESLGLLAQFCWMLRAGALEPPAIILAVLPPLPATAIALGAAEAARCCINMPRNFIVELASYAALFLVFYLGSLRFLFTRSLAELINYLPARRRLRQLLWLPVASLRSVDSASASA